MEENIDLKILIPRYIDYIDIREISKISYKKQLEKYQSYLISIGKEDCPTRKEIQDYREYLEKRVHSATIAQSLTAIRGFYIWCYDQGYGSNISSGIRAPKLMKTFKREPLDTRQAKRLVSRAKYLSKKSVVWKRNYAIVALLLTAGLRTIEIERANTEDLQEILGQHVLYIQGKGHDDKDAYIKISNYVYSLIENYLIERNNDSKPLFMAHGNHKSKEGNSERRMKTKDIRYMVKELLRQIDLDSKIYSAHSLRHTCATLNLENGGSLEETQEMLRHKSIETTMIYSHHNKREKNNSEINVSNVIFGKDK